MKDLIEDRLKLRQPNSELELTEETVPGGMKEFASRANLSVEEFTKALGEAGVEPETFRDFRPIGPDVAQT